VVRATLRDTGGTKYVVIVKAKESWKVTQGLQRLRRGSQVRALGISGITGVETQRILEKLGWPM